MNDLAKAVLGLQRQDSSAVRYGRVTSLEPLFVTMMGQEHSMAVPHVQMATYHGSVGDTIAMVMDSRGKMIALGVVTVPLPTADVPVTGPVQPRGSVGPKGIRGPVPASDFPYGDNGSTDPYDDSGEAQQLADERAAAHLPATGDHGE